MLEPLFSREHPQEVPCILRLGQVHSLPVRHLLSIVGAKQDHRTAEVEVHVVVLARVLENLLHRAGIAFGKDYSVS